MLYPQSNSYRQLVDLSGFWEFRIDPESRGEREGWQNGFVGDQPIAVPASWNDLLNDLRNYLGDAWYETRFACPWGWDDREVFLRFGSVNYRADVWLNGTYLGKHVGGHLPFEFPVTLQPEGNRLVVRVNGEIGANNIPPGKVRRDPLDNFMRPEQLPDTSYDFFPYAGIHRPVLLYATPTTAIDDVTVTTEIDGANGQVSVEVAWRGAATSARATLSRAEQVISKQVSIEAHTTSLLIDVPDAALWSPAAPNLYDLMIELLDGETVLDRYTLPVGIRTVRVEGDRLLLNGEPVVLRGFGRHEDFHLAGRGYQPVVALKDYELMRWIGANSFRTTHYPYAEQTLDLADQLGFLVIAEAPSVEMYFHADGLDARMAQWSQTIRKMIARDKNHPSVILWSIANEPHNRRPEAREAFEAQFTVARSLDASRPLMFVSYLGMDDVALGLGDVIGLNRYKGWYSESGDIVLGVQRLSDELDAIHRHYNRPILITEFGADTIPGMHAQPPVMFSEEYQVEFLTRYLEVLDAKPYIAAQHVWNLCDFSTGQAVNRVGSMNYKGVFTRERQPKMAAHRLREWWQGNT